MKFEKITIKVEKDDEAKLHRFLLTLGDMRSSVNVRKSELGSDKYESVVTFNVESDKIDKFKDKLNRGAFNILTQGDIDNQIQSAIDNKKIMPGDLTGAGMSSAELQSLKKKRQTLEDLIEEGNYNELLAISKDIRQEPNKKSKAKAGVPRAVKIAIEYAHEKGLKGKSLAFRSLDELIKLAINPDLKQLGINDLLIKAGNNAIEICTTYDDFADDLVKIANNIKLHNSVNVKALIKFSQIVLSDPEKYALDIDFAIKNMNMRWLRIAFDAVVDSVTQEEKNDFNNIIDFIEEKRLTK